MAEARPNPIRAGATLALTGTLLSGPIGVLLVNLTHPQPPWESAAVFIQNYHWVQVLPYFLGMFLLIGSLWVSAAAHELMAASEKHLGKLGFGLTLAACTLIFFNYIVQASFLPHQTLENSQVITQLSMSNPSSLAWSLEMWGYCLMGLGLWLSAPAFNSSKRSAMIRFFLALNGIMGILGALATAAVAGFPLTPAGLVSFIAWNLVYVVLLLLIRSAFP